MDKMRKYRVLLLFIAALDLLKTDLRRKSATSPFFSHKAFAGHDGLPGSGGPLSVKMHEMLDAINPQIPVW